MKILLILGMAGAVLSFAIKAVGTGELKAGASFGRESTDLEVSLVADKRAYRRGERIKLEVIIINNSAVKDIFVYGTLEFGTRKRVVCETLNSPRDTSPTPSELQKLFRQRGL